MEWLVVIVCVLALLYVLGQGTDDDASASKPPRASSNRHPARNQLQRSQHGRSTSTTSSERWSSRGREIPFAEPGLVGPIFEYGGVSFRGAVEHRGPFAVIDFETTGLSPKRDRIVEVAVARLDVHGRIEDEFATLVNPEGRDVGPTFIHGITNDQVKRAPTFAEVVPELLSRMSGAVIVAHNATFEEAFLAAELKRAEMPVPSMPALCTLWLGRQTFATPNYKLGTLARAAGVALVDKHAALGDVRAVSALLPLMLGKLRAPVRYSNAPVTWATTRGTKSLPLVTRAVALRKGADGWMHSLVARLPSSGLAPDDAAAEVYLDGLTEVLSDGRLTREEAQLLAHLAGSAGMGGSEVLALNQRFLDELKVAALEDDVLTPTEIRQLRAAAKALSLPDYYGALVPTAPSSLTASPAVSAAANVSTSRAERIERAAQALTMQRGGATRAEIASALGVGVETVKSLLRDAKFRENPQSDPSRLALARDARRARDAGLTCDQFRTERDLSSGKGAEAWRDAMMLEGRI